MISELDECELRLELLAALPRLETGQKRLQEDRLAASMARLPQLADAHVESTSNAFGKTLAYDEASFAVLDEVVREGWPEGGPVMPSTIRMFAAYLGETVLRVYGGHWHVGEEQELMLTGVGEMDIVVRPFMLVRHAFERPAGSTFSDARLRLLTVLRAPATVVIG